MEERAKLSSMADTVDITVQMTPREVKKTGKRIFTKIRKLVCFTCSCRIIYNILLQMLHFRLMSWRVWTIGVLHLDFFKKMYRLRTQRIVNVV